MESKLIDGAVTPSPPESTNAVLEQEGGRVRRIGVGVAKISYSTELLSQNLNLRSGQIVHKLAIKNSAP